MSGFSSPVTMGGTAGTSNPAFTPVSGALSTGGTGQSDAPSVSNGYSRLTESNGVRKFLKMPVATGSGRIFFLDSLGLTDFFDLYPASGDAINGTAANTSLRLSNFGIFMLVDYASGNWTCLTLIIANKQGGSNRSLLQNTSAGFEVATNLLSSGTFQCSGAATLSSSITFADVLTGITAHAGGGQGSATAITHAVNVVSTVGSAGDSCVLPTPSAGLYVTVANTAAVNSMNLFPASGHIINNLGANTQIAVAAGKVAHCTGVSGTAWIVSVA